MEEPTSRSLTELLDKVSSRESDNNVSQPEGNLLLTFPDEMTSSIVSSAFTPRCFLEPLHPYIDQGGFLLNCQHEEGDPQRLPAATGGRNMAGKLRDQRRHKTSKAAKAVFRTCL